MFQIKQIYSEGSIVGISKDFQFVALLKDTLLEIINVFNQEVLHSFSTDRISSYNVRFVTNCNLIIVKITPYDMEDGYVMQSKDANLMSIDMSTFNVISQFPEQKGNLET